LVSGDQVARRASLSCLLPTVASLLNDVGREPSEIELVVAGRGPGSYTGVRIGLAAAKGLGQGLGAPVLGVGTLDAVAWGLRDHEGLVGVVGDAMRQEVYPALFEVADGAVRRLTADRVAFPADVAREWATDVEGPILLAGDGLGKHGEVFLEALGSRAVLLEADRWLPTGASVLAAAWAAGVEATTVPGALLPVYTRLSDAEHREPGREACSVPESGVAGPDGGADATTGERGGGAT
jgi:N6-L-threonylcarbamoyladenine synthase